MHRIALNFYGQKFHEKVKNHANINFRDKNFVITRGKPTPIAELWTILNFCDEYFHDWMSNHEIHKNIVPQKFGAIQYFIPGRL